MKTCAIRYFLTLLIFSYHLNFCDRGKLCYMDYKIFAWISVVLLFYNFSLFPLRKIMRNVKGARKFLKIGSLLHKYTGLALIITGFIHGYLALGIFIFHTGWILWFSIILLFAYYLLRKVFKRKWMYLHRYTDFLVLGWFFVHLFLPWLL